MLFEEIERTLTGPSPEAMGYYEWINLSAEPYAARVRELFETLFADYPDERKEQLRHQIRSDDNSVHRSFAFELLLYAWVKRLGHSIISIEPSVPNSNRRPDFLVRAPDRAEYYLEVTARQEERDDLAAIKDAVNALPSPIYLHFKARGRPSQTLSARSIARRVGRYIERLDPEAEPNTWQPLRFCEQGVQFEFTPFQKKRTTNQNARTIGWISGDARSISSSGELGIVIGRKAGRYGRLDKPYIIAVASADFRVGLRELSDALFGTLRAHVQTDNPRAPLRYSRNANGIWHGVENRFTNTGVSAVLLVPGLTMTSFAKRRPLLMIHPEPRFPANADWFEAQSHAIQNGEVVQVSGGAVMGSAFNLDENWPEESEDHAD